MRLPTFYKLFIIPNWGNNIEIRRIELTDNQIQILHCSMYETLTKNELFEKTKISLDVLDKELQFLKRNGLIYMSETFGDIVSIIHF